jgi:hypothetical protein
MENQLNSPHRIEIDIAGEPGYEERTKAWAKKFDCIAKVITHNGPAGGNPLYEIVGTKDNLRKLFEDYCRGAYIYPINCSREEKRRVDEIVASDMEELFQPELLED